MHAGDSDLVCSDRSGTLVARVGVPLADVYLEFLSGRCRPNTVRAAAYDLKVFFTAVAMPLDKAAATVTASDARHLAWLRDQAGDAFAAGIILHIGPHAFPVSDRIVAAPVSTLWS